MGHRLAVRRRRLRPLLLQHRADARRRHPRGRPAQRPHALAQGLWRADRQPQGARRSPPKTSWAAPACCSRVFIRDPQFQGQTKEKLASVEAQKLVDATIKDHFDHWLTADPDMARDLLDRVIEIAEERAAPQGAEGTHAQDRDPQAAPAGQAGRLHPGRGRGHRAVPGRGRQRRRQRQAGARPRNPGGAASARQDPERRQRHRRQAQGQPGTHQPGAGAGLRPAATSSTPASCAMTASSS